MEDLFITGGEVALWRQLIVKAESEVQIDIDEDLESYLVFLLMRLAHSSRIGEQYLALEYLKSRQLKSSQRRLVLRDIGDKCLIFAGLFPGLSARRRVELNYYIQLGQTAYDELAHLHLRLNKGLYGSLSQQFIPLSKVLQATRNDFCLDLLQAYELQQSTHGASWQGEPHGLTFNTDLDKKKLH